MTQLYPSKARAGAILLAVSLFCAAPFQAAHAQSVATLTVGSASGLPGTQVNVSVALAPSAAGVSSLQFDIVFPTMLAYVSTSAGPAASAANKVVSSNVPSPGTLRIVIWGMGIETIGNGAVAVVRFTISGAAPPGTIPLAIVNIAAADPSGQAITVSGVHGSVTVLVAGDQTPPVISGVSASGITFTTATIGWTTNEPADTQVEYGVTAAYGSLSAPNTSLVTLHSQALSGLAPATTYHYRVRSKDAAGNLAVSGDFTFTTETPDTTPPVISDVEASSITHASVSISWTTNEPADSQVEYGTGWGYGSVTALNASLVTIHRQTLNGLAPGTTYNYRVRSKDAAGNLALSAGLAFITAVEPDTTPPFIYNVTVAAITSSSAVITWITDELSDSQVQWGTTISYGRLTTLDSTMVTAHSQILEGLEPSTTYHFLVRSKDAAGNLGTSGNFTFTTERAIEEDQLKITGVAATGISSRGATITWSTNRPADTTVEYGTTTAYGSPAKYAATPVTQHSQTLSGLQPNTLYHYRVRSTDEEGKTAVSGDHTFLTLPTQKSVIKAFYPLLTKKSSGEKPADEPIEYTGIAVANLSKTEAVLTFVAYDIDGNEISGAGIVNPAERILAPGQQLPVIDVELFGAGIAALGTVGWITVESTVAEIAGFSMIFDDTLSTLDGANASYVPLDSFVLSEIDSEGSTSIYVANPNDYPVTVEFELVHLDGTVRDAATRQVTAGGTMAETIVDLFPETLPEGSDYIRARSTGGVVPFQLLGRSRQYLMSLNGHNANSVSTRLYAPQFAAGGQWRSTLSIVNLDDVDGTLTLRLIGDNGAQIGATRVMPIAARGKIQIGDPSFFLATGNDLIQGYVEIIGHGIRLTGSGVFGDPDRQVFATALPLLSQLQDSMVFSQVGSNETYFTGIAMLNPHKVNVVAKIDLYRADGALAGTTTVVIPAKRRISKLISELFPSIVGQNWSSGYLMVKTNLGVASYAVFGTNSLSVLSAIPPQQLPF